MILSKMQQDRTTLLITLCKRFLYNSESSHISFSSSSTNTLSFASLLLCNLTGTRCVPTPLLPSSLQTFLLGSLTSTHMFPLLLSALTHFCWSNSIKFQFPFFKLFLLFFFLSLKPGIFLSHLALFSLFAFYSEIPTLTVFLKYLPFISSLSF